MSLKDPDDDYDELLPQKKGKGVKIESKYKTYLIILVIGVIIGVLLQVMYINPLLSGNTSSACLDCTNTKQLLNNENDCLYSLLSEPKIASEKCASRNFIEKQNIVPKDYNEEA